LWSNDRQWAGVQGRDEDYGLKNCPSKEELALMKMEIGMILSILKICLKLLSHKCSIRGLFILLIVLFLFPFNAKRISLLYSAELQPLKVAVVEFNIVGRSNIPKQDLGKRIANQTRQVLDASPQFKVLKEVVNCNQVPEELLLFSGYIDSQTARQLEQELGAVIIVAGNASMLNESDFMVNGIFVDTRSAKVCLTEGIKGSMIDDGLPRVAQGLAEALQNYFPYQGTLTCIIEKSKSKEITLDFPNLVESLTNKTWGIYKLIETSHNSPVLIAYLPSFKRCGEFQLVKANQNRIQGIVTKLKEEIKLGDSLLLRPGNSQEIERESKNSMLVTTGSLNARVYLNDSLQGISPLIIRNLSAGTYSLKLTNANCQDWTKEVMVEEGENQLVEATLQPKVGTIVIRSTPERAKVYLDGNLIGETKLELNSIPYGKHHLVVSKPGYKDYQLETQVEDSQVTSISTLLTPRSDSQKIIASKKFSLIRGNTFIECSLEIVKIAQTIDVTICFSQPILNKVSGVGKENLFYLEIPGAEIEEDLLFEVNQIGLKQAEVKQYSESPKAVRIVLALTPQGLANLHTSFKQNSLSAIIEYKQALASTKSLPDHPQAKKESVIEEKPITELPPLPPPPDSKIPEWDKIIKECQEKLQVDPNNAELRYQLGVAYYNKGFEDEGIAELKRAIHLNPNYSEAHYSLGVVYWNKNMPRLAAAEWEKCK